MKIAHVIPHSIVLPLDVHNGRYDWMLQLARLQTKQGHDVTIYCNPASDIEGIVTRGISDSSDDIKSNNIRTFQLALQSDHHIYHSHFDNLHYELAHETTKPIVFTQHWWPTDDTISLAQSCTSANVWAVPPTQFMHGLDIQSGIATKGHIYHGINLELFQPSQSSKNGRLLFAGRIAPEKNLGIAISVAKKSGLGLDIIGKVATKSIPYWRQFDSQIDGSQIRYLGPKTQDELPSYYSSALALLFPSEVTEPFGLTAIESQACGTPVIMLRGGSRGELIIEGKTGFLCSTESDFITAIQKASSIQSYDCITFAQQFDVNLMVKKYEDLYKELLAA